MSIPSHRVLWPSILDILKDGKPRHSRELEEPLARRFKLTEEDLIELYPSGNGPIFLDRINWALSFLSMADLVERPKPGIYQITRGGRSMLGQPERLAGFVRSKVAERKQQRQQGEPTDAEVAAEAAENGVSELTPEEQLWASFQGIRRSLYETILTTILSKTPQEFEKLVVKLLERMGYGGEVKDAGQVTRYTSDGGIDGVIKEDVLGLGRVHIQAKRYARGNAVGREEVQKFVGALAVAQSKKGVFITTSTYTPGAIEYARSLHGSTTVVLIDGEQLAGYIYDYGLGMQVQQTIEIKKLDSDFWSKMQDA